MSAAESPSLTAARRAEREAQERRLAVALRDNLKRRKAQARAQQEIAAATRDSAPEPRG